MDHYDVIIIGTGAGGGTLARHLAPSGKRILLLERGDWLPREPAELARRRTCSSTTATSRRGHLVRRRRQAVPAADPLLRRRCDQAVRRGALPAAPEDFGELRHHDGVSPAWPITYDESSRTTRWPSSCTRSTARAARTRPSRRRARPTPSRGLARAAHPAAPRRPGRGRLPPVPRAVRHPAERGEHAVQRLRPLPELRRLPVRGARQVRRRGARRPAGARASERHPADQRAGRPARDERHRHAVTEVVVERDGADGALPGRPRRRSPAAPPTRPKLLLQSANDRTRTASRTARTRSAGTTCSTTARPCSRSRARRTRRSSRRRSG